MRGARVSAIRVAAALSLLLHAAVLWPWLPQVHRPSSERAERADGRRSLSVELVPKPSPPPARPRAASRPQERPPPQLRAPKAPPRAKRPAPPRATPPAIALDKPAPGIPSRPQAPAVTAAPSPRAPEGDLASYVEAKRRARADAAPASAAVSSASPAEDANERANRIAAANLGTDRTPTFGSDKRRGGGIFSVQRLGYDYAEFVFFGWNKDIRRNTQQLIEVRKGSHSDIRLAVVRRMIAIIREHEDGDFIFESQRLGRNVTLSARARDNSGLEDFMMREFFEASRP